MYKSNALASNVNPSMDLEPGTLIPSIPRIYMTVRFI